MKIRLFATLAIAVSALLTQPANAGPTCQVLHVVVYDIIIHRPPFISTTIYGRDICVN